jgi:hypothetical protein
MADDILDRWAHSVPYQPPTVVLNGHMAPNQVNKFLAMVIFRV